MIIDGFLIDLDGVILSNMGDIVIDFTYDFMNKFIPIGKTTITNMFLALNKFPPSIFFRAIFGYLGISEHLPAYVIDFEKLASYKNTKLIINRGFSGFLDKCSLLKIKYLLFSSQSIERLKFILNQSMNWIIQEKDYISLEGISKANVEDMLTLLKSNNIENNNWFFIDDDPFIIRTAKLAGLNTMLMRTDFFSNSEIIEYDRYFDYTVESFEEINILIDKLI